MKGICTHAILAALVSVAIVANVSGDDKPVRAWDFGSDALGSVPAGWSIRETNPSKGLATWQVIADPSAPSSPNVIGIVRTQNRGSTFNIATADGTSYKNLDLSVRVKPISGRGDQGGGPVWRCRDENNYYVARFNPLESNFRVYYVKSGRRRQLQSARVHTKPGSWYTVRVTMIGNHIIAYLDGKKLLEATDNTFKDAGMFGLWTKADAATWFDDLHVAVPQKQTASALTLRQTIALPGVKGRIDHLTLDASGKHLFIAALENGSLEVIDLNKGKRTRSIGGLNEPQGILYLPNSKRVVITCGGDGAVHSFDANTLKETSRRDLGDDADNIRWEASTNQLFVGFGDGAIAVLDAESLATRGEIRLAGHPESLQLDTSNGHIYVNVPDARRIAVIDRSKNAVSTHWDLPDVAANYPMALDQTGNRLFAACRKPPRLLVIDTQSGARLATMACVGDADDIFYDSERNRIYVIGGEGFVDVFDGRAGQQKSSVRSAYPRLAHIPTSPGARTALFVPKHGRLYVALPAHKEHEAEVRVFEATH